MKRTEPLSPSEFWFPKESAQWDEGTRERYIERLCIWSDGGPITFEMYRAAQKEANQGMKP